MLVKSCNQKQTVGHTLYNVFTSFSIKTKIEYGLTHILKYYDGSISIWVCNQALVIKYMQTMICLGGVKKSRKFYSRLLRSHSFLQEVLSGALFSPPPWENTGCAWVVEDVLDARPWSVALCMIWMHGTCGARLGYWDVVPSGFWCRGCFNGCWFKNWFVPLLLPYNDDPFIKCDLMFWQKLKMPINVGCWEGIGMYLGGCGRLYLPN